MNRYAYAQNDAVNLHDPLGLDPIILPPDYGVPEGTCYYFGNNEICHSGTGESNNSNTGKGRRGRPGSPDATPRSPENPKVLFKNFLDKNKHCRDVFLAIKFPGNLNLLDQLLLNNEECSRHRPAKERKCWITGHEFVNAGIVPQGDADENLIAGQTGLGSGPQTLYTAYTNAFDYKIFLGLNWGHNQYDPGAIVAHELLHTYYNLLGGAMVYGEHFFIARELNIRVDPGVDPADAIDMVGNNCRDPKPPKKK